MLFFMAAGNVLDTCEDDEFKLWLQIYGIVPMALAIALQILSAVLAMSGNPDVFKIGLRLQVLPQLLSVCLLVWGWITYSKTSKEKCVPDDGINPRTFALVWLIIGSIGIPGALCGTCMKLANPTAGMPSLEEAGMKDDPQVVGNSVA